VEGCYLSGGAAAYSRALSLPFLPSKPLYSVLGFFLSSGMRLIVISSSSRDLGKKKGS
jgi:hypothetical protein